MGNKHVCPTCGEALLSAPNPTYHEDFTLPGITTVLHEFPEGRTIRIHNAGIVYNSGVAAIPVSQLREGSVRKEGERGVLIVSKWLALRRSWIPVGHNPSTSPRSAPDANRVP